MHAVCATFLSIYTCRAFVPCVLLYRCCAGEVNAWGCNLQGQCGMPGTVDTAEPTIVRALLGVPIAEVAAGLNHTLARSASGDVYSWGSGDCGQLGHSTTRNEAVPRLLEALDLERQEVASIACGSRRDSLVPHHLCHSLVGKAGLYRYSRPIYRYRVYRYIIYRYIFRLRYMGSVRGIRARDPSVVWTRDKAR
jgi:hypothetical protein